MKLSEAVNAGQEFAAHQQQNGRYWRFTADYSLAADDIAADVLFTAYLGLTRGKGLIEIARTLQFGPRPTDNACFLIQDTLFKHWRVLGQDCRDAFGLPLQHPVSLWKYLVSLNDEARLSRNEIAGMLRTAGY